MGPYRDDGTSGHCVERVGINGAGYTSSCDRGPDSQILSEFAQLGTTVSGVERPICSAVATSSTQEETFGGWGGGCDIEIDM